MKSKKLLAVCTTALLAIGLAGVGAVTASADQPVDLLCTQIAGGDGWSEKTNTTGDPATVAYTAPAGFLVDQYCVKAGTEPIIIQVTPPAATIVIDHPNKDSVSHWMVHLIPIPVTTPLDAAASATPTDATCEAPGGVGFSITNATWDDVDDVTDGSRTATADAGHLFSNGLTTLTVTYTIAPQLTGEQCGTTPLDAAASATPTDATCEAPGGVGFSITNATWDDVDDVTDGSRTATADAGHLFSNGLTTLTVTYTIAPQLTGERCEVRYLAPSAFDPTCPEEPEATSGYIQLDLQDHLHYTINGVPTTQATNFVAPGTYTIGVTVDPGFTLIGPSSWDMVVNPPFCPPTLALLSTTASMSNLTCSAAGSYTLADTEGIEWFVNGSLTATPAGTYPRSTAGTVTVEAKLADPVNDGWEDGAQKTWTFNFTNPADCLPTLAFTGSDSAPLGLLLAGGFLLVGGAVIAVEKRLRREAR